MPGHHSASRYTDLKLPMLFVISIVGIESPNVVTTWRAMSASTVGYGLCNVHSKSQVVYIAVRRV